ncbi:MAG: hypothetical protein DMF36_00885 [Verrucomicrobia bacterium]|nr:MAG: hypothetical protein AUH08_12425 [Verrucomicrobia bacterium 13_2_20CM_54_12]OLB44793.1 MAG: hypothetical protein AUI00_00885 [Verrucomicrobia bacterium 13_2_20CM_2_54_15]OLD73427.1 MAG: hypothetical protein AUF68_03730 [Verrucomicrobia bacterium 13_1_20CM_54_28]OLD87363.1 MAG: hypothetical protein AUG81_09245 [Verrucomicrobia bacterium 13_1_20CM_4_54_11]OLE10097.1 MAG: hypothetical protein AUG52_10800 [Verrucomicrobia bacterium 13_1_20CM_3_54_17]PYK16726.1 MAG: hypothetical protein DME
MAALFRIPSTLAAQRHPPLASQFVNFADVMCSFVQNELPFSPGWEFPGLLGLKSEQPRILIGQISSFVMDSDCSAARRPALPPFAFAQEWALPM